jgi:pimeloyl-ACP methyl ester carboxylesterase
MKFDRTLGFDNFIRQLDCVFERTGLERAALCGVSYGGFIALRYAAMRPDRVASLVLVSSPAPGWVPNERQQQYLSRPWRSAPAVVMTAPFRLWPEIRAAYDTMRERLSFSVRHAARVIAAPTVPPQMAARVKIQQAVDFAPDCGRINVPTLIVSGQDELDQIVPAEVTRRYQQLIRGAQYVQIKRSGHIGLLTHPAQFADIVSGFINGNGH